MKLKSMFTLLFMPMLMAASAYAGGLDSATSAVNEFRAWFFAFLGVAAFVYLMIKGAQLWADSIRWIDFGTAIGKVAIVGGVSVIVSWAWTALA